MIKMKNLAKIIKHILRKTTAKKAYNKVQKVSTRIYVALMSLTDFVSRLLSEILPIMLWLMVLAQNLKSKFETIFVVPSITMTFLN